MDLVQGYCVTRNDDGTYFIEFNTTAPATVLYSTDLDGTNVIKVNEDKKGKSSFKTTNYKSGKDGFKFTFEQPDGGVMKRIPSGGMIP